MTYYINRGEGVFYPDGTLFGFFTRNINAGDQYRSDDFVLADGSYPIAGEDMPKPLQDYLDNKAAV